MKKWVFLLIAGIILGVGQMAAAAPAIDFTGVWFSQNYYDTQYFPYSSFLSMHAVATIKNEQPGSVTITSTINGEQDMTYLPGWYFGNPEPYLYVINLSSNPDIDSWENTTYTFDIYTGGGSTPVDSRQLTIGEGVYKYIDIPRATYDAATRTVFWDSVAGIDEYKIRFFNADDHSYCYYSSDVLPVAQTSYVVPWEQFEPGNYRIRVEARDWDDAYTTLYNRSTYTTIGSNPVPIPSAVWLLLSGLIGLAGVKRKRGGR